MCPLERGEKRSLSRATRRQVYGRSNRKILPGLSKVALLNLEARERGNGRREKKAVEKLIQSLEHDLKSNPANHRSHSKRQLHSKKKGERNWAGNHQKGYYILLHWKKKGRCGGGGTDGGVLLKDKERETEGKKDSRKVG